MTEILAFHSLHGDLIFTHLPYARLALPLGATALYIAVTKARVVPAARVLALAGVFSLGIYAIHAQLWWAIELRSNPLSLATSLGKITVDPWLALIGVPATVALVWLLSKTPLRRFIS